MTMRSYVMEEAFNAALRAGQEVEAKVNDLDDQLRQALNQRSEAFRERDLARKQLNVLSAQLDTIKLENEGLRNRLRQVAKDVNVDAPAPASSGPVKDETQPDKQYVASQDARPREAHANANGSEKAKAAEAPKASPDERRAAAALGNALLRSIIFGPAVVLKNEKGECACPVCELERYEKAAKEKAGV